MSDYGERMQEWDDRHRNLHEQQWNDQGPGKDPVDGFASSLGCAAAVTLLVAPFVLLAVAGLAVLQTLGRYGEHMDAVIERLGAEGSPVRAAGITLGVVAVLALALLVLRMILVRGWVRDPATGRAGLLMAVVPATLAMVLVLVLGLTAAAALALVAAGQGPDGGGGDPVPSWAWIAGGVGILGWTTWFSLRAAHRATLRAGG